MQPLGRVKISNKARANLPPPNLPQKRPASSPSKFTYRLRRFWLRKSVRILTFYGLPICLILALAIGWVMRPETQGKLIAQAREMIHKISSLPDYTIASLQIEGASEKTRDEIKSALGLDFPTSALALNFVEMKATLENMGAVKVADIYPPNDGRLTIIVDENIPVLRWQRGDEMLLIDQGGAVVRQAEGRESGSAFGLIIGQGAAAHTPEALRLFAVMRPLGAEVFGLRFHETGRWDVLLSHNRVIMLPEKNPVAALEHILRAHSQKQLLTRAITHVDARIKNRLTVRLGAGVAPVGEGGRE